MNQTKRQTEQFFANVSTMKKWCKTFGIDHMFFDLDSRPTAEKKQDHSHVTKNVSGRFANIEDLKNAVLSIDCTLKNTAKNTVFSDGNPQSQIMIIGEAPGMEEDEQGKPFVGQSGQLLNNMLKAVGINRFDVYVSNIVFWRPPGNRQPSTDEIAICLPFVEEHIMLAQPKILLLLGAVALRSLLRSNETITSFRGKKTTYNGITTIPTFHPAYLLRSPLQKAAAFRDFITLKTILQQVLKK